MKTLYLPIVIFLVTVLDAVAEEREITVINPSDNAILAGTLAEPVNPRAAIVLATGSGQQDRDESAFGHKPFKTLSDALSDAGYAVLRMDDRGAGKSKGDMTNYTTDTYVGDIHSALCALDSIYPGIKKGVIGHSEGGLVAIMTGVRDSLCDFIVTLAAPAWSGDSIIMSQSRAMSVALTGKWDGEKTEREFLNIIKMNLPDYQTLPMLWALFTAQLGDALKFPGVQEQLDEQIKVAISPWYKRWVSINPEEFIESVSVPWLALNGDRDFQVLSGNLQTISSLNPSAKTILLKDHNHMFQETKTGMITDYERDGQSPSSIALETIITFLNSISD